MSDFVLGIISRSMLMMLIVMLMVETTYTVTYDNGVKVSREKYNVTIGEMLYMVLFFVPSIGFVFFYLWLINLYFKTTARIRPYGKTIRDENIIFGWMQKIINKWL